MRPFRSLAMALLVLAVPLTLITTNIRFAASEHRVYDYSVREYGATAVSRIPQAELLQANRELVRYFTSEEAYPLHIVVTNFNGRPETLFNARETAHLGDVRDLFQRLFTVQQIVVALTLGLAVFIMVTGPLRSLALSLVYAALFTFGLVGLTGALALTAFDDFWTRFHLFAFANDFWRLDPAQDHLIQMFPRNFWLGITLLIGAFTVLEATLLAGACGFYLYLSRPRPALEPAPPAPPALPPLRPHPPIPPPRPRHLTR